MIFSLRGWFPDKALPEDDNGEARRHRRHAVLLKATIYPIDTYREAVVHDISDTGLMGEADLELAIGQVVHVSFDEENFHTGIVRWTRGRRFGLDVREMPALDTAGEIDHGAVVGHLPRAERKTIKLSAKLNTGRPPRPATVRNVSRQGLMLDTSPGLAAGQLVLVNLGKRAPIAGRVQWSRGGRIGVKTRREISALKIVYFDDEV